MGQISLSSSLCTRLKAHQKPKGVKRSSPPPWRFHGENFFFLRLLPPPCTTLQIFRDAATLVSPHLPPTLPTKWLSKKNHPITPTSTSTSNTFHMASTERQVSPNIVRSKSSPNLTSMHQPAPPFSNGPPPHTRVQSSTITARCSNLPSLPYLFL